MTETLHQRIRQRLDELETNPRRASVDAGLSPDFLRTFFNRPDSSIRSENLAKIAKVLDTTPDWLLTGNESEAGPVGDTPRTSEAVAAGAVSPPRREANRDIPVYGLAAGAITGQLTMSNDPIEYKTAPDTLARVRDAYALIVTGTSMEPKYEAGDYVWIHPHKPIRKGDHVVIQELRDGGTVVSIKRFEKLTDDHIVTTQYNPLATINFSRKQVVAIHRVLTTNELAGV